MYFLAFDPEEIKISVLISIRTFLYNLGSEIYRLMMYLYDLFEMLCNARIVENSFMSELYSRVGLILGLIMLFRVIFSFIQMLINPDILTDKDKGAFNLVKKILVTIVLLGIVPYLFSLAYKVQDILLTTENGGNIISRLVLPVSIDTDNFGGVLSSNLLFSFYKLDPAMAEQEDYETCQTYMLVLENEIMNNRRFDLGLNCLAKYEKVTDSSGNDRGVFYIDYNPLFSILTGLAVCWFLLVYCFSVGVRVVQLAFLQIIAPMPIISYLSPKKDGMFQKWGKMCLTTYLDVFIRVGIINFVILLIGLVLDNMDSFGGAFWTSTGAYAKSSDVRVFLSIIIILALLQFAKKAPELLKELLPKSWAASGDFSFGLKNRDMLGKAIATVGGVAAGGAVGLIGGVAGGNNLRTRLTGAAGGILGGTRRGITSGIKNKGTSFGEITKGVNDVRSKQADVGRRRSEVIAGGSTFIGRTAASVQKSFGIETAGEVDTREIGYMDTYSKFLDSMKAAADNNGDIGKLKREYENAEKGATETDAAFAARKEALRKQYKNAQKAYISAQLGDERFITARNSDGSIAGFRYNSTGSWDDESALATTTTSFSMDTDDPGYGRQIVATAQQANRYQSEHSSVLGNLATVTNYGAMENNTNEVNARRSERIASRTYDRNKANNKFSSKK